MDSQKMQRQAGDKVTAAQAIAKQKMTFYASSVNSKENSSPDLSVESDC